MKNKETVKIEQGDGEVIETSLETVKPQKSLKSTVLPQRNLSVEGLISQAIAANVPIETLERLLTLRTNHRTEEGREAFVLAMSGFQSECPVIEKKKEVMNKDGRTVRYTYAPLGDIVEQIKKPLAKYRLSYTWKVESTKTEIKAIAIVTHSMGHSNSSDFTVPIDTEGYMTAPQKTASALTFAKRYSLCNALGISTAEEDNDATTVEKEKDTKSIKSKIILLLRSLEQKNGTKEEIEKSVKTLTKLDLEENNFDEIVGRLQILVSEKNEN
jgi:hypothetical protein